MPSILETPDWRASIYRVEMTDRVLGGPNGAINIQAKNLADRTSYLKDQLAVVSRLAGSYGTLASSLKYRVDRLEAATGVSGPVDGGVSDPGSVGVSAQPTKQVKALTATNDLTVPVNEAEFFDITLTSPSCLLRLDAFLRISSGRIVRKVDLMVTQGSGANKIVWADSIRWAHGRIPVLSFERGYSDMVTLISLDQADTWIGYFAGGWTLA